MGLINHQLRIADPQDRLKIYDLDESKGITTLGQEPANDIVLKSPGVAPVRLVLDYRQQPCTLSVPGGAEAVTVNGEPLQPGGSCEIHDRDAIQVAGYTITFRTSAEEPADPDEPPLPPPPPEPLPPTPPDEPVVPPPDVVEPAILTSISEQAWTVDVGQAATIQLTVINAGDLVANFVVAVEGVPQEWVTISPAELHLNEKEQGSVAATIIPPRSPASSAGPHHLTIVVTSPIYPDERSTTSATITINPYYDLVVGNLSPRRQTISWSQAAGRTEVSLTNRGNSDVAVLLAGEDDAHACRFEFEVPAEMDEPLYLTRQVELRLPCDSTARLPVRLIPQGRPLIGPGGRLVDLRPRIHPYTITVAMAQGEQGPWSLIGEWETSPRFSRRVLSISAVVMILLLLVLSCAIFDPRITNHEANPTSIRAGQVVTIKWKAWPPFLISYNLDGSSASPPIYDRPKQTTTYEIRADTWLSHLWPALSAIEKDTVEVRPVKPDILLFEAQPEKVTPGEKVVLSWVVDDADELVLIDQVAGYQETLSSPCGSREIRVGQHPAYYTLRATAADGSVAEQAVVVQVASPVIQVFSVKPAAITSETGVELSWLVLGATDGITLSSRSFDKTSGEYVVAASTVTPYGKRVTETISRTTEFSLAVRNNAAQAVETARVRFLRPTPTPTPTQAPTAGPSPTPPSTPTTTPESIVVYTALSPEELASFTLPEHVSVVRRSTEELLRQILAEKEDPQADVIWMVAATGMIRLRAEGLLEPLAGLYQPQGMQKLRTGWIDQSLPPQWLGLSAWPAVLCVNVDGLPVKDDQPQIPGSWDDLIGPKYDGRIVMPSPYSSGTGYMLVSGLLQMSPLGEAAGWAYLDRLHENVAWYTTSGSEPCTLAAEGTIAIGISAASGCSTDQEGSDAAIRYIFPEEGYGWEMDAVALVRKDTISPGALAFLTWAIGEEAMQEYARFRPVLASKETNTDLTCFKDFHQDKMIPSRFLWASANYERITQTWLSRYGSGPELIQLEPAQ